MKTYLKKSIAALMTLALIMAVFSACGKGAGSDTATATDGPSWGSLGSGETTTAAAGSQFLDGAKLKELVEAIMGHGLTWNGDFSSLTDEERDKLRQKLSEEGYDVTVTPDGIIYKNVPAGVDTPTDAELKAAIAAAKGKDYKWNGSFADFTAPELSEIQKSLRAAGYDVKVTNDGIIFNSGKKTVTDELMSDVIRKESGGKKEWNGDYSSLDEMLKEKIEKALKDKDINVNITDKGPIEITEPVTQDKPKTTGETTTEPEYTTEPPKVKAPTGVKRTAITAYGGAADDRFVAVAATPDGGFAALGNFRSGDGDYAAADPNWVLTRSSVVKFDKNGKALWQKLIGGNNGVTLSAICVLKDGSIVAAGSTISTNLECKTSGGVDAIMVKYAADGTKEWVKALEGSEGEYFSCIAATPDGGFVAGGKTQSADGDFVGLTTSMISAFLMKFDKDGNRKWNNCLSGKMHNNFAAVSVNDYGYIFASCETLSSDGDFASLAGGGSYDSVLLKLSPGGEVLWHKTIGGSAVEQITAMSATPDGGCVLAGMYSASATPDGFFKDYHNYGMTDGAVIKLASDGKVEFVTPVSGAKYEMLTGVAVIDGGYAVTGFTESDNMSFAYVGNRGNYDGFIQLLDTKGKEISLTAYGGSKDDRMLGVTLLANGTLAGVGGAKSSDSDFNGITPASNGYTMMSNVMVFEIKR